MAEHTVPSPSAEAARAKEEPHLHVPRLVMSKDVSGEGVLDQIADFVNRLIGSMWLFVGDHASGSWCGSSPATSSASTRRPGRSC